MGTLTKLQTVTLALIKDGKVYEINTGYGSWRIQGAAPSVVGKVRSLGLAEKSFDGDSRYNFRLTEAGHAALAASEGGLQ